MLRKIGKHLRDQWAGFTALFLVLCGGTAWAVNGPLAGQNTVGSEDIIGNEVKSDDIGNGRIFNLDIADEIITGAKLKNETVTGTDVVESTLAQVPSAKIAAQGGVGRSSGAHAICYLSGEWTTCGSVALNLTAPGRVLVIGRFLPRAYSGAVECRLGSSQFGGITGSELETDQEDFISISGITPVLSSGGQSLGIDCRETNTDPDGVVFRAQVTAVALSAG